MAYDTHQQSCASDWRVAAMCYVGAAAREANRATRLRYLLRASECLDEADRLTAIAPSRPRLDS